MQLQAPPVDFKDPILIWRLSTFIFIAGVYCTFWCADKEICKQEKALMA